jgi:hypothetical protein
MTRVIANVSLILVGFATSAAVTAVKNVFHRKGKP